MQKKLSTNIKNKAYQQCTRCIMDTSAIDITFDDDGVCNFCTEFLANSSSVLNENKEIKARKLVDLVDQIKAAGRGKRYDCIIGVSGGVDSSWVLVQAVDLGLRPLAVHMDNGWNSELAQNNIANLVRGLSVDLFTYVVDWDEYRELMQAFFDADVIDIELLYDNAMYAVNYYQARKYGIRYILSGNNTATEGMSMPKNWNWFKRDKRNIYGIYRHFNGNKIKSFPAISVLEHAFYKYALKISWVPFLDYTDYIKEMALENLERNFFYKRYLFKHYESIFTRFYQGYLLPSKFSVDKRLLHFSTLIISGQISREEATKFIEGLAYASQQLLNEDIEYFLKKMRWTSEQLDSYIKRPEIPHDSYPTEKPLWDFLLQTRSLALSLTKVHE
jgi:N-acetyl sugar amidotransferase